MKHAQILFVFFILITSIFAQTNTPRNTLYQVIKTQQSVLSENQNRLLNIYKNDETTEKIEFIDVNTSLFEMSDVVDLPIEDKEINLEKNRIEYRGENDFSWFGKVKGKENEYVIFVVKDNNIFSSFSLDGMMYTIKSLGDGVNVFIKVNLSKQKFKCGTEEYNLSPKYDIKQQSFNRTNKIFGSKTKSILSPQDNQSQIDILFLYTPYVDSQWTDIEAQVQYCIDWTNQAFINSEINTSVNLTWLEKIDYAATDDPYLDIQRLRGTDDGYMDSAHIIRANHQADLVVLSENIFGFDGIAALGGGHDTTLSFCIVSKYITPSTFAHELGHLFGCRHDTINDSDGTYNHGYQGSDWRTIMAYPHPDRQTTRIQYFSNPNLFYKGERMGSEDKENNARVINEAALFVARLFLADTTGNNPPNKPTNISPPNGSIVMSPGEFLWSWEASDPDGDSLIYHVFSPGKREEWVSSTYRHPYKNFYIEDSFNVHVNWYVIADDAQYQSEKSDTWEFDVVSTPPYLNLSSPNIELLGNSGSSKELAINTNVSWSISNNIPWIDVSLDKGYQNTNILISTKKANYSTNPRIDTLIISTYDTTKTVIVSQGVANTKLNITPSDLSYNFGSIEESNNPSTRSHTFTIKNSGGGTLTGNVSENASWLSLSDSSFSLTNEQTKSFIVTANTTALSVGSYTGTISVTSNGGNENGEITCEIVSTVGIDDLSSNSKIPDNYYLSNNYPNPFNPSTKISFGLPEQSTVSLVIYDITGKVVKEFLRNEQLPAGSYNYYFEASNLSSGIYIYKLQAGKFAATKKLILMK